MASKEQKRLMQEWYDHTGWEFMRMEEVRATDPAGFMELWEHNANWLDDRAGEARDLITEYRNKHLDLLD
jgi:hypothetical protein